MGPYDILNNSGCGCLDHDLRRAALGALDIPAARCRAYALEFSWQSSARQFLDNTRRARNLDGVRVAQPAL